MNLKSLAVWTLIPILFLSCQPNADQQTNTTTAAQVDLKKAIPGVWESVSLQVIVHSVDNTDSSYVFDVPEERWISTLGVKPIKTFYELDNKYRSEYRDRNDSLVNETRGIWNVFGDTLMLIAPDATYQYEVTLKNGLGEFRSLLDWDGDGQEDDEYLGIQRYVSRSTADEPR